MKSCEHFYASFLLLFFLVQFIYTYKCYSNNTSYLCKECVPCNDTNNCDCGTNFTKIDGNCCHLRELTNNCLYNEQCKTKGASCILMDIDAPDKPKICACPKGWRYNGEICMKTILGSFCRNDTDCDQYTCYNFVCSCNKSYRVDLVNDKCVNSTSNSEYECRGIGVIPQLCGNTENVKCLATSTWERKGGFGPMLWKFCLLSIILILLTMLLAGIQKARQNETLISWNRALVAHHASIQMESRCPLTDLSDINNQRAFPSSSRRNEDPPSYEEALNMNNNQNNPNNSAVT